MSVRHNATTLPAPGRRAFITNTGAAVAGLVLAGTTAIVESAGPGAVLLTMYRRWQELSRQNEELEERVDGLWAAAYRTLPPPEAIKRLVLGPDRDDEPASALRDRFDIVNRLKQLKALTAAAASDGRQAALEQIEGETAELEGLLSVLDDYEATIKAERTRNGYDALRSELAASSEAMGAIEAELAHTPADDPMGMLVKMALVDEFFAFQATGDGLDGSPDFRLVASLALDLQRLAGVTISELRVDHA